jgi:hypothetical protein
MHGLTASATLGRRGGLLLIAGMVTTACGMVIGWRRLRY